MSRVVNIHNLLDPNNPLYLITDRQISGLSHIRIARLAIDAGVRTIQLREKHLSKKEIYKIALSIRNVTLRHKVNFIVNDHVDIALAVRSDGVHVGQDDMPVREVRKIVGKQQVIGVSTHTVYQAIKARQDGADYIGFGPVFRTGTKDAGQPKGLAGLNAVRKRVDIPIVAIGGITWENLNDVCAAGADLAASASGILTGNIRDNIRKMLDARKII